MRYETLHNLRIPKIGFGTWSIGGGNSPDHSRDVRSLAALNSALELGYTHFDTAEKYAGGHAEELLGQAIGESGIAREKIFITSKVWPNHLRSEEVLASCAGSLRRLKTDYIDLYQMHHVDRSVRWEEIWQSLQLLVEQGKVIYTGSSNFAGWHIARAQESAARRHFLGLVSEQSIYNLRNRMIELEVVPACEHYGVGIIPWAPIAGGLLGGALEKVTEGRRTREPLQKSDEKLRPRIQEYESLCRELGHAPADVALAWVLSRPGVTSPIVGPRTLEQFRQNLGAMALRLDEPAMKRLDEIWPGPGGAAPEAYAW